MTDSEIYKELTKIHNEITNIKIEIATLKAKASMWGSIAAVVVVAAGKALDYLQ